MVVRRASWRCCRRKYFLFVKQEYPKQDDQLAKESYYQEVAKLCITAIEDYLSGFSSQGLSILNEYERQAEKVICFQFSQELGELTNKRESLQQLQNGFNRLLRELEKVKSFQIINLIKKYQNTQIPIENIHHSQKELNFPLKKILLLSNNRKILLRILAQG